MPEKPPAQMSPLRTRLAAFSSSQSLLAGNTAQLPQSRCLETWKLREWVWYWGDFNELHMIFHTEHDGFGAQIENDRGMMLRGFEFHCLEAANKT